VLAPADSEPQRALAAAGDFRHPYYWAPFVLTGDWF